ncbi:hypothetical protein FKG94_08940 [Exilibacterium tricleocarpae]|uniref:DUF3325 domain-containing protein n=1 Tax=Exilibacterium tricleocarpae TaxID=2591008 RepID=A0A545TVH0_9GAMM|nr:hypothetical protein [Exilibacterium tricleocarpae]TQV81219.1 hypothetical protein FKG94_08940 [Exilibacterium tricleocarpae]
MITLISSLLAVLCSGIGLVVLSKSDAKRHRKDSEHWPLPKSIRWLTVVAVLLPGFALGFTGLVSSLLVWLGAITVSGWLIALLPRRLT